MSSSRQFLINSFLPAQEVDSPEHFSGRFEEVKQLTDALQTHGSCPLIFGDRGLGKSSLALQIRRIAMGDVQLLDSIGIPERALCEAEQYLTFYVTCTDATEDLDGLLQLLINAAESVDFTSVASRDSATQLVDKTTRRRLTLKLFEYEQTKKHQAATARANYTDLNLTEKLQQLAKILVESYDQRVLFIIDEVDRLARKAGLASFLKAASSPSLKFILVGIASNVSDLLADHRSLERSVVPVRVPLMTRPELEQIVDQAENAVALSGTPYRFELVAKDELATTAGGFPWFVHVLGQTALIAASEDDRTTVTLGDVIRAKGEIVGSRFAQQFADTYQSSVRDSAHREIVLRLFAEWRATNIPTSEVYRVAKSLGVTNPSIYKRQLESERYGSIFLSPSYQKRGLVQFIDEMFKTYIRLRSSIYLDVDTRVLQAAIEAWRTT
jgi:Cdc6-like AAA superfamily ATPase